VTIGEIAVHRQGQDRHYGSAHRDLARSFGALDAIRLSQGFQQCASRKREILSIIFSAGGQYLFGRSRRKTCLRRQVQRR
jgi:hypothetical protein